MKSREIILTEDGSATLYIPELNEHYHSIHGAVQESQHIFIRAGFQYYISQYKGISSIQVLEAGFGTGLNAYLTMEEADITRQSVQYCSLEKYPLSGDEVAALNYMSVMEHPKPDNFKAIHETVWEENNHISPYFMLRKCQCDFRTVDLEQEKYNIIYYDAFNPNVQPDLWTEEVFYPFYNALVFGGILVTYCVKGTVKRALRSVGFSLERLPGPPGKREMLRATKVSQKDIENIRQ